MRVKFYTLGCKVNQYETQALREKLVSRGFEVTDADAELHIINTCSVTARADTDSRKLLIKIKKMYPGAKIAVCGCWVNHNKEELIKLGADYVIKQEKKPFLADILKDEIGKDSDIWSLEINEFPNQRAFLKVQDGCDNFCSFCKVPFLRGRSRSRKKEDVIAEANRLSAKHKEIILCGINLGLYGKDLNPAESLAELTADILKINSLSRLRLSSLEPLFVNGGTLELFKHPKMCPHLHLPFQSGDNAVLKAMNKKESVEMYKDVVNKLKAMNSDIAISCDIIVGFPGETQKNFENTLEFINEVRPMRMHIFTFSPREKTRFFGKKIDVKTAKARYNILKKLADGFSLEYRNKFIGRILNVVAEEKKTDCIAGYSENYIKVNFRENNKKAITVPGLGILGKIVQVRIEETNNGEASGFMVR
ncbi:MAG: tRNA (N(6)-L-threonylcarbamoyladenosine(37)-C(2))-methylthiotransferase MtaB [Candidatus Omnitrophota bacterium]|jgi:threonylcarbamoyladenosine tRNA methylthiotransferase MtaB